MAKELAVTLESGADGQGTFVVICSSKSGGGHWAYDTNAYDALQRMLKLAGGISRIGVHVSTRRKAIRFIYIPHKPESLTFEFVALGDVHWTLEPEGK